MACFGWNFVLLGDCESVFTPFNPFCNMARKGLGKVVFKDPIDWEYPGKVADVILSIQDPIHRGLFAVLYGTGGRVGEVVSLRRKDVYMQDGYIVFRLRTEKRKDHPYREIPLPVDKKREAWIVKPIMDVVAPGGVFQRTDAWLFPSPMNPKKHISVRMVQYLTKKYWGPDVHPHLFRHTRATHLTKHFDFDVHQLTRWMGWTDFSMAMTYVHLRWKDYVR